ncbi:DNAse I-like superfamily protein [Rhynchospora pubera]|uniref:DNAse I-like superfamily protein n=1 Tax=Rhynchospora pubera TaxID=906938 RepID=A0AAV8DV54_9POAL|nr:DNAse I-like superfamily protein [Rhynchospora pubera]
MRRFMNSVPNYEFFDVPARDTTGGLCMAWNGSVKVDILNSSLSYICARVTVKDKPPWVILGVYGDPNHFHSRHIWETLTQLIRIHDKVCLLGDFNEILDSSEKFGGSARIKQNTIEFQDFVFSAGLLDLGYKGPAYTWTNNRSVSNAIYQRLDRVLVTPNWLQLYPNAYVNHLPMIHSDHCPILLRIKKPPSRQREFRIENWWLKENGFQQTWVPKWEEERGRPWQEKWREMRKNIQQWAKNLATPKKKLDELAKKLHDVQMIHPMNRDHSLEVSLLKEYSEVEAQHESYWRQRSRLQWEEGGDRNTKYFHTVATNRRRYNLITAMEDENGMLTGDEDKIRAAFVTYFKNLYNPSIPSSQTANNPESIAENPIDTQMQHANTHLHMTHNIFFQSLSQSDTHHTIPSSAHQNLTRLPDYHEVRKLLFKMGPDKSPGPDGVNCRFLQENWAVLGPDLVNQMRMIFSTAVVPEPWLGCNVILIPKKTEPLSPVDYRPISIGNVIYVSKCVIFDFYANYKLIKPSKQHTQRIVHKSQVNTKRLRWKLYLPRNRIRGARSYGMGIDGVLSFAS